MQTDGIKARSEMHVLKEQEHQGLLLLVARVPSHPQQVTSSQRPQGSQLLKKPRQMRRRQHR